MAPWMSKPRQPSSCESRNLLSPTLLVLLLSTLRAASGVMYLPSSAPNTLPFWVCLTNEYWLIGDGPNQNLLRGALHFGV